MKAVHFAVFLVLFFHSSLSADSFDRIGFAEDFKTIEGWKIKDPANPLAGLEAKDGVGIFKPYVGGLSAGIKPADQAVGVIAVSSVTKEYIEEIDLDKYHYIVMKTDEKSAMTLLELNKKEVHVAYSTGIFAEDLTPLGLKGKQKLTLDFEIMNCGNPVKIDYIRLVSSLTEEEKAGLIMPPLRLRKENIKAGDYQGLEALYKRAARPFLKNIPEEKVYFRDTGTGARLLRITANPVDEGMSEGYAMWEPDGSSFYVKQTERIFYYEAGEWGRPGGKVPPGINKREKKYVVDFYKKKGTALFQSYDPNTGEYELLYETPVQGNCHQDVWQDKMVALTDEEVIVVKAGEKDKTKMVKRFKVPEGGFKGMNISPDGKYFYGNNPWGSYRQMYIDLETGEVFKGGFFTWTHGMSGTPWSIMSYGGLAKLAVNERAGYKGNSKPGDLLKIFGVFDSDLRTDYGTMTRDGRYGITNGNGGELNRQHLLFDRFDPGTILRLCTWRISRIEWNLFTKTIASPDYTKLALLSDMFGNGDYYFCMIRLPDAPQNLSSQITEKELILKWEKPERNREIRGYNVYAAEKSGGPYKRVQQNIIKNTEYKEILPTPSKQIFYLVAAEEQEKTLPMREYFDGYASGYRSIRVTKAFTGEDTGNIIFSPAVKEKGEYTLWARVANKDTGKGKISFPFGAGEGIIQISSKELQWVKAGSKVNISPDSKLTMASSDDGAAVDKIVLTNDDSYIPQNTDDRKSAPAKVSGLKVNQAGTGSVELSWNANTEPDLYLYSVYVSEKKDFEPGNATVLCSGEKTMALDWGLKPDTKYYYKVTAIDKRGNESEPVLLEAKTLPLKIFKTEIPAEKAVLAPELRKGKSLEVSYVEFPLSTSTSFSTSKPSLTFEFEVPEEGRYYFWGEFSPRNTGGRRVDFFVDGKSMGTWNTREPFRLGKNNEIKPGGERWFVERIAGARGDSEQLKAGKHILTLSFDSQKAGLTPLISKVWISNDPSYLAPGYNCQERFNDLRRQAAK